jgi:hypothetical protein
MEGSTKAKIAAAIAAVLIGAPIYLFSDGSMRDRTEEAFNRGGGRPMTPKSPPIDRGVGPTHIRDPEAAKQLVFIMKVYKYTFRQDDAYISLIRDWLRRYGGDDSEWPDDERYFPGTTFWTDEDPRPDYYNKMPHPLTARVLSYWADYYEKKRLYSISDKTWETISKHFSNDPSVHAEAEKAKMRAKVRTF